MPNVTGISRELSRYVLQIGLAVRYPLETCTRRVAKRDVGTVIIDHVYRVYSIGLL